VVPTELGIILSFWNGKNAVQIEKSGMRSETNMDAFTVITFLSSLKIVYGQLSLQRIC